MGFNHSLTDRERRSIPEAAIESTCNRRRLAPPTMSAVRGIASKDQTSIFSAISIASSTSMPRYLTVLSIFECPRKI